MRYVYNAKERELRDLWERKKKGWHRRVSLTRLESKLLMLLSDNELHRYEEIEEYLYNDSGIGNYREMRIMPRLKKKLKNYREIKIKTRVKLGYYLKGNIYIE